MPSPPEIHPAQHGINPAAPRSQKSRAVLWMLVRLAVGVALLVYLAKSRLIDFAELRKLFTAWPITVAALALVFLDIFFMSIRLCGLFQPQNLRLPLLRSLDLTLVSSFFATLLPGAAGGDLAKLFYAARDNPGRRAEIVTIIGFDRAVGLFSILLLPMLFAPLFVPLIRSVPTLQILLVTDAALAVAMAAAFLLCVYKQTRTARVAEWASRFLPGRQLPERIVATIGAYGAHPSTLLAALAASLASNLTLIAATGLGIWLIAPNSLALKMCLVVPMGDVANSLPLTPGGLGVGETAFSALFKIAGLEGGAEALLYWRIWRALVGLVGLAVYLKGMRRSVFSNEPSSSGREPTTPTKSTSA